MKRAILTILMTLNLSILFGEIPYVIKYEGIDNDKVLEIMRSVSQLETLKAHPPATLTALSRRAEADIPNLVQALQTYAHYKPKITFSINTEQSPVVVTMIIETGKVYPFKSFEIFSERNELIQEISLQDLGIVLGEPAYPKNILNAESFLVNYLSWKGYPIAHIVKREIIADVKEKTISVELTVDPGPEVVFGRTTIKGLSSVHPALICRKIDWFEGMPYNPSLIDHTQQCIEDSGLFASVIITIGDELDESGELPVVIDLIESKHRTVGIGASYTTQLGPGFTAEWELRNMRGLGEKLAFLADVWSIRQRGVMLYRQPDFRVIGQDILWIGEYEYEKTEAFTESFFSLTNLVERRVNDQTAVSAGLQFKQLDSTKSNNDGTFSLIKVPLYLRWNTANNLMDPTYGQSLYIKLVPTVRVLNRSFMYYIQTLVGTFYYSFDKCEQWTLATKVNLGTIFGAKDRTIPPPERFYAGNEHTLRGYRYMTVSPLGPDGKPIGGRSLMVYSAELRSRIGNKFGWVAFYEVGNVYQSIVPDFDHKQLQSVGFGIRYHTPVGPLRADVAVPLNRRRRPDGSFLDKAYELYFSIGQAF
ncbi:MAG: Translocation and assembly module TamA [Chlamydiae bacterium]|nr:Translocation and assembly module TamA [Chlamydiota bacterium]